MPEVAQKNNYDIWQAHIKRFGTAEVNQSLFYIFIDISCSVNDLFDFVPTQSIYS